jgi:hypothetical protein
MVGLTCFRRVGLFYWISKLKKGAMLMIEMKVNSNAEYLMSVHLLKKLKANHLISDEEFDAIDKENRKVFLKAESLRIA